MQYISAEEFKKEPIKVQQVLWDWWKPSKGDLFENDLIGGFGVITEDKKFKNGLIPLLTEGQLRQFIEDKTSGKIEFYPDIYRKEHYYTIMIRETETGGDDPEFEVDADNALQAYWKVALEIAKEEIN